MFAGGNAEEEILRDCPIPSGVYLASTLAYGTGHLPNKSAEKVDERAHVNKGNRTCRRNVKRPKRVWIHTRTP